MLKAIGIVFATSAVIVLSFLAVWGLGTFLTWDMGWAFASPEETFAFLAFLGAVALGTTIVTDDG